MYQGTCTAQPTTQEQDQHSLSHPHAKTQGQDQCTSPIPIHMATTHIAPTHKAGPIQVKIILGKLVFYSD